MKYRVVAFAEIPTLEQEVNKLIQEGWQPLGGVSICQSYDVIADRMYYGYAQAMIHRGRGL